MSIANKKKHSELKKYSRKPHALQRVLAPSGPLRHSGVSVVLQE